MFLLRAENGYVFHYANQETDSKNQNYTNWLSLSLHEDFVDCLKKIGRPIPSSTAALIEELKSLEDQKKKIEELEAKLDPKVELHLKKENQDLKAETQELKGENQVLKGEIKDQEGEIKDLKGEN